MGQLNLNTTPEFERSLARLMRLRRIRTKSEAVRIAVEEAARMAGARSRTTDFGAWLGLATKAPLNPAPRFRDDASLWE